MAPKPVNIRDALASFDEVYSPRIATRMNDYDVKSRTRSASTSGTSTTTPTSSS